MKMACLSDISVVISAIEISLLPDLVKISSVSNLLIEMTSHDKRPAWCDTG